MPSPFNPYESLFVPGEKPAEQTPPSANDDLPYVPKPLTKSTLPDRDVKLIAAALARAASNNNANSPIDAVHASELARRFANAYSIVIQE